MDLRITAGSADVSPTTLFLTKDASVLQKTFEAVVQGKCRAIT